MQMTQNLFHAQGNIGRDFSTGNVVIAWVLFIVALIVSCFLVIAAEYRPRERSRAQAYLSSAAMLLVTLCLVLLAQSYDWVVQHNEGAAHLNAVVNEMNPVNDAMLLGSTVVKASTPP